MSRLRLFLLLLGTPLLLPTLCACEHPVSVLRVRMKLPSAPGTQAILQIAPTPERGDYPADRLWDVQGQDLVFPLEVEDPEGCNVEFDVRSDRIERWESAPLRMQVRFCPEGITDCEERIWLIAIEGAFHPWESSEWRASPGGDPTACGDWAYPSSLLPDTPQVGYEHLVDRCGVSACWEENSPPDALTGFCVEGPGGERIHQCDR